MTPFHRDRPWFTSGSLLVFTVLCVSTRVPHGFPTESPPRPTCSPPLSPDPQQPPVFSSSEAGFFQNAAEPASCRWQGPVKSGVCRAVTRVRGSRVSSRLDSPFPFSAGHCSGSGWAAAGPSTHPWEGVRVAFKWRQLRMQLLETRGCVCVAVLSGSSG